jgi:putative flippase GtrA
MPDQSGAVARHQPLWQEFLRYLAVGALALAADAGVLKLGLYLGLHHLTATAAGFMVGLTVNYLLCVTWAWRGTQATTLRDFAVFTLIGVGGLGLTELLMWLAVDQAGIAPMVAKLPIAAAVFVWNFGLRRILVFFR